MRRIPQPAIRKYCRDQRFVLNFDCSYEEVEYRFRITNIKGQYNDSNPLQTEHWEDIILNIVIDGTVKRKSNGEVYQTQTLQENHNWELQWNPRGPRRRIRRNILSGCSGYSGYYYGSQNKPNLFTLFLKCLNMGSNDIKLGTIRFGKVPGPDGFSS